MEWAEDTITRLRSLWDEGHSTREIGRRLGVSGAAVVGKAHRLDLPARPSPIRRNPNAVPRSPAPPRIAGPTLPALTSIAPILSSEMVSYPSSVASIVAQPRPEETPLEEVLEGEVIGPNDVGRFSTPAPRPYGRIVTCCWPIGEPGTRNFRYCDIASEPGKPYCSEHVKLAYVRIRDRREDAA